MFDELIKEGALLVLICSGVPLVCGAVSGVLIALLQTVTQIQEQSLGFLVKFITVSSVIVLGSRWFLTAIELFVQKLFALITVLGAT